MAHSNQVEKSLGEQVADLLDRMPQNYDVTFCVGPDKIKVKAIKILLKAVSPIFQQEFDSKWENGVIKGEEGIPLPDVDPTVFETFVMLIISDTWSVDALNALNMSPNTKLSLLGLCRRYEITKAIKNLEEVVKEFLESFEDYKDTPEFLELSQENLEMMFTCDEIPVDENEIFECACRWAGNQCTIKGLETTGENYREVLGGCLFQIRFPTMSNEEFTKVCFFKKNVLKIEEQLDIFLFMGLSIDEKTNFGKTQLQFKTNPRAANQGPSFGCSVLSLPQQYKLTTSPSFQVMQKISLHGIGFLGPIDGDTQFDVTVQINRRSPGVESTVRGTLLKQIFAKKGKIFYFLLDEPLTVESSAYDKSGGNLYYIIFSLKGTSKIPQYKVEYPQHELFQTSGVQFQLRDSWNNGNPLAELLFKKI